MQERASASLPALNSTRSSGCGRLALAATGVAAAAEARRAHNHSCGPTLAASAAAREQRLRPRIDIQQFKICELFPSDNEFLIQIFDTQKDPRAPTLHKVVEPQDAIVKTGLAYPHTAHCLASGDIMVSCLGGKVGKAEGNGFLLLDSEFNVKGRWEKPGNSPLYRYDFWYRPRHKTMISSSWGAPLAFTKGFNLEHVSNGLYGKHLHVYSWPNGELKDTLDLGNTGLIPLEIRFLHDLTKNTRYAGCALSSTMVRFFKKADESWGHEKKMVMLLV